MDSEKIVVSHRNRRIFRWTETNMITIEIAAGWIRRCERPEIMIDLRSAFLLLSARKRSVILRDRLHRPIERVARDVLHRRVERDAWRIRLQPNGSGKLNSGLGIGRTR